MSNEILQAMPEVIISDDTKFAKVKGVLKFKRFIERCDTYGK